MKNKKVFLAIPVIALVLGMTGCPYDDNIGVFSKPVPVTAYLLSTHQITL